MTAFTDAKALLRADAAPTIDDDTWNSLDWARTHQEVRKLQVRIAKAAREGRWRKVKALQWLLTHSFSAKALAVRRVTENQGKKTPGVDGETWSTPATKSKAIDNLKRLGYRPKPLRRVYIPKSNGKKRPLGIPTMKDRAMQALHMLALEPVSETTADWNSYGFRPERSTADAIGQLFVVLSRKGSAEWVLEGDIKGCFDHISHEWMLKNICTDTEVLAKWLKAGYVDEGKLFPTEEGTPQGGIISPVLANLVLDGIEDLLGRKYGSSKLAGRSTSQTIRNGVHFVRYADDFVVTSHSRETLENEIKPLVRDFLADRGLTLSQEKTKVTHISEGFDFLGQNVRKYRYGTSNEKLLIKPSKKNVKTFLDGMAQTIRSMRTARQVDLINALNLKVQGWANYHRHVVSKDTFNKVDHVIWRTVWRWAKRRHPSKSTAWVKNRYFRAIGERSWCFSAPREGKGKTGLVTLKTAMDVEIRRHTKIRGAANPFNPADETYFEERLSVKMAHNLAGRRRLLFLWKRQQGKCPVCAEAITKITKWHVHHLMYRVDGGPDRSWNLVLLHPTCHRQGHAKGFSFVLPVGPKNPA